MAVLQGRVVDPSGAALPGASVVVRDAATGLTSIGADRRRRALPRAGDPGGRVPGHGRGSRVPFRAHRIADVRGRPHAGARFPAGGRHAARSGGGERGTAAARSRDERRRTRRVGADRPGDSAQRPPLHRSRTARARVGGAVADGVLDHADPRHRRARVQYRPATARKPSATSSTA